MFGARAERFGPAGYGRKHTATGAITEMAKQENRVQVILECTECRKSQRPGVSRYVTTKNRRTTTNRVELQKYCKFERKHTLHRETK